MACLRIGHGLPANTRDVGGETPERAGMFGRTTCDRLVSWRSPPSFVRLLTTVAAGKPSAERLSWLPPRRLASSRRVLALLYAYLSPLYPVSVAIDVLALMHSHVLRVPRIMFDRDYHTIDCAQEAIGLHAGKDVAARCRASRSSIMSMGSAGAY